MATPSSSALPNNPHARDATHSLCARHPRKRILEISAIHNEEGYREIRNRLSSQYNLSNLEPNIQIWNVDLRGDRSLTLRYIPHNRAPLDRGRKEVLKHVHRLWGFDVMLEQQNEDGSIELLERCPPRMGNL